MSPAFVFHSIACCVTHLYFLSTWQQSEMAMLPSFHKCRSLSDRLAKSSYGFAKSSYGLVNSSYGLANSSYGFAKPSYGLAKSSYRLAKPSYRLASSSYGLAKLSDGLANSSYGLAKPSESLIRLFLASVWVFQGSATSLPCASGGLTL